MAALIQESIHLQSLANRGPFQSGGEVLLFCLIAALLACFAALLAALFCSRVEVVVFPDVCCWSSVGSSVVFCFLLCFCWALVWLQPSLASVSCFCSVLSLVGVCSRPLLSAALLFVLLFTGFVPEARFGCNL
jgi:uncharacterized membrane protein